MNDPLGHFVFADDEIGPTMVCEECNWYLTVESERLTDVIVYAQNHVTGHKQRTRS